MKKEVNLKELLQLIYDNKIKEKEIIYGKKSNKMYCLNEKKISKNDIDFINDTFIVNIELSADELFEQLGYEKNSDDEYSIEYRKISDDDLFEINFWKKDKTISKNYYREMGYITRKELQAINKKVEELGWLQ